MINVTKTFLPSQLEYQDILKKAWDKSWITNRGVLVQQLEKDLKTCLGVDNIIAMANGTLPLQIAIKALQLKGEIITTPFSYVATVSSIVWEGCKPVFVDIDEDYLTIDETKIEKAITTKTSAILATHVFGNPCNIEAIETLANKYNLKVIYDAAHCFGVTYNNQSIFKYGDVSTCSFHATKLFHTGEGGALFCKPEYLDTMFYHHNFGHKGQEDFYGIGINAKMNEMQAAMGLAILPHIQDILEFRKQAIAYYDSALQHLSLKRIKLRPKTDWNFSYYPVIFKEEKQLLLIKETLEKKNIFPRRYFYPSLNELPYIENGNSEISSSISKRILCLPLSHEISQDNQDIIIGIIKGVL